MFYWLLKVKYGRVFDCLIDWLCTLKGVRGSSIDWLIEFLLLVLLIFFFGWFLEYLNGFIFNLVDRIKWICEAVKIQRNESTIVKKRVVCSSSPGRRHAGRCSHQNPRNGGGSWQAPSVTVGYWEAVTGQSEFARRWAGETNFSFLS